MRGHRPIVAAADEPHPARRLAVRSAVTWWTSAQGGGSMHIILFKYAFNLMSSDDKIISVIVVHTRQVPGTAMAIDVYRG